jgi:class 3 adenylate cyclase
MGYFGYYANSEIQCAINAVNAALELNDKFSVIINEWIKESNIESNNAEINVKRGIHTGDLLFGILETEYRNQITVIGPTVNFASRLEGEAEKDQILMSGETREKVKSLFTFDEKEVEINKTIIQRYFEAYNNKNEAIFDEIIAPEYIDHGQSAYMGSPGRGVAGE